MEANGYDYMFINTNDSPNLTYPTNEYPIYIAKLTVISMNTWESGGASAGIVASGTWAGDDTSGGMYAADIVEMTCFQKICTTAGITGQVAAAVTMMTQPELTIPVTVVSTIGAGLIVATTDSDCRNKIRAKLVQLVDKYDLRRKIPDIKIENKTYQNKGIKESQERVALPSQDAEESRRERIREESGARRDSIREAEEARKKEKIRELEKIQDVEEIIEELEKINKPRS